MKKTLKNLFRKLGYEVSKYSLAHSAHALQKHLIQQNQFDLIIDVGANSGQYGVLLREIGYVGKIISFEPIPAIFTLLQKTASQDSKWEIHNYAIGNEDGTISINVSENTYSSSILPMLNTHLEAAPESRYVKQESIAIKKLSSILTSAYLTKYKSILLKIDVQGYEMPVIEGAIPLLPGIKMVQTELSFVPLYEQAPLYTDIIEKMKETGFDFFTFIPEFIDQSSGRLLQADGVFVNRKLLSPDLSGKAK
ncbi:FkbM family methyltransferase [Rhodocytophaga rosea]|uniref:FkbM family methyltransferase n=1 Tax=Rhodocytophaga rosea TaxID=2704465 RepID=A0A6C0GMI4_9BACT|nr:FkbM family methyltransferase [Rhodocytophaga rosea]QHT68840.1 FkbM family methyltransferase [Rhodocytophaga rosea]